MGANTVTLGYAASSDLVGGIVRSNGADTAFGYEADRDLVTQIAHAPAPPADPMAVGVNRPPGVANHLIYNEL